MKCQCLMKSVLMHGTVSTKTYFQYFIAGGGYFFTLLVVATFLISDF